MTPCGFLHSEICGSKLAYSSPQLIAVNHVLHRLSMPRHSPCAHIRFTFRFFDWFSSRSLCNFLATLQFFYPTSNFTVLPVCLMSQFLQLLHCKLVVSSFLHYTCYSVFKMPSLKSFHDFSSGVLQAKLLLSNFLLVLFPSEQISEENFFSSQICFEGQWAQVDSNHRPHAYQACALTG